MEKLEGKNLPPKRKLGTSRSYATNINPVSLKGLFNVSITSTKPVSINRAELIRGLEHLSVECNEIRGGFESFHTSYPPPAGLKEGAVAPILPLSNLFKRAKYRTLGGRLSWNWTFKFL
jgi:hypothetical protein